jgi:hypothetical protein
MTSGYTDCKCRDCFETAISDTDSPDFCWECEEAGCEEDSECSVERSEDEPPRPLSL